MTRRSVDLPQPLGPMSATIPPAGMARSMPAEDRQRAAVAGRERERDVVEA